MPNTYKTLLQFVSFGNYWKEQYYIQSDTPQNACNLFDTAFLTTAIAFRHPSVYIAAIRCSDVTQPRLSFLKTLAVPDPKPATGTPDVRNTCALYILRTGGGQLQRHIWIRGLLDSDVVRKNTTGADDLQPNLDNGMVAYMLAMQRIGLMVRALNPITNTDPYKFYDCQQITVDSAGNCTLTCEATAALGPSNRVILSLFDPKDWPGLKGAFTAKNVVLPSFSVAYKAHKAAGAYTISRGHYRVQEFRQFVIDPTQCNFVRFGSRVTKTGPFSGRGARKAVRLRSQ